MRRFRSRAAGTTHSTDTRPRSEPGSKTYLCTAPGRNSRKHCNMGTEMLRRVLGPATASLRCSKTLGRRRPVGRHRGADLAEWWAVSTNVRLSTCENAQRPVTGSRLEFFGGSRAVHRRAGAIRPGDRFPSAARYLISPGHVCVVGGQPREPRACAYVPGKDFTVVSPAQPSGAAASPRRGDLLGLRGVAEQITSW